MIFEGSDGGDMALQAANRSGRRIELRVAVTPLLSGDDQPSRALLLIEPHDVTD